VKSFSYEPISKLPFFFIDLFLYLQFIHQPVKNEFVLNRTVVFPADFHIAGKSPEKL